MTAFAIDHHEAAAWATGATMRDHAQPPPRFPLCCEPRVLAVGLHALVDAAGRPHGAGGRDLQGVLAARLARVRGRRLPGRTDRDQPRLRHGESRPRRAARRRRRSSTSRRCRSSSRLRRFCCWPRTASCRWTTTSGSTCRSCRTSGSGSRSGTSEPHERHPGSVDAARPRRLALFARSDYRRRRAAAAVAAEGPELHAGRAPSLFQQRLHAAGGDRQPRQRQVVPRIHDRADLHAARDDAIRISATTSTRSSRTRPTGTRGSGTRSC